MKKKIGPEKRKRAIVYDDDFRCSNNSVLTFRKYFQIYSFLVWFSIHRQNFQSLSLTLPIKVGQITCCLANFPATGILRPAINDISESPCYFFDLRVLCIARVPSEWKSSRGNRYCRDFD